MGRPDQGWGNGQGAPESGEQVETAPIEGPGIADIFRDHEGVGAFGGISKGLVKGWREHYSRYKTIRPDF